MNIISLMLLKEMIAVYKHKHIKSTNTLCGQNEELFIVKASGTNSHHKALEG
jgi:hypothetical protein